jgi:hypothetical protein
MPNSFASAPASFLALFSAGVLLAGCAASGPRSVVYQPPGAEIPAPEKEPPMVTPGSFGAPPSSAAVRAFNRVGGYWLGPNRRPPDAVVLFDGSNLSRWVARNGGETQWVIKDSVLESVKGAGYIQTRQEFGDFQLHIEWATPAKVEGNGQGRGNSGVFLHGRYEIQVLDSWENQTYFHGQAGAIYKQHAPRVNASRPPGEWQTYDFVFRGPRYDTSGKLVQPAFVTVLHNGILIHDQAMILGTTSNRGAAKYEPGVTKGPLALQDHGNPVRFRNIWLRPL